MIKESGKTDGNTGNMIRRWIPKTRFLILKMMPISLAYWLGRAGGGGSASLGGNIGDFNDPGTTWMRDEQQRLATSMLYLPIDGLKVSLEYIWL